MRLIEAHLGVSPNDYSDPNLAELLSRELSRLTCSNVAQYVHLLSECLTEADRSEAAGQLLLAHCGDFAWLDGRANGPFPEATLLLASAWLRHCGWRDRDRLVDFCERLLQYVRQALRRPGTSQADRHRFVGYVRILQQQMRHTLQYLIRGEADRRLIEPLRRQAIQSDAELGQWALYEQLVVGEFVLITPQAGASLPALEWPYPEAEASLTWQRFHDCMNHTSHSHNSDIAVVAFDLVESEGIASPRAALTSGVHSDEWLKRVEELLGEGIGEARLARVLGPNTVLLRATFDNDGTLRWWVLLSNGCQLSLLEDNLSAAPSPSNLEDLLWAAALHDLEVECVYLMAQTSSPQLFLEDLICRAEKMTSVLSEAESLDGVVSYLTEFLEPLNRSVGLSLIPLLNAPPTSDVRYADWWRWAAKWWAKVVSLLKMLENESQASGTADQLDDSTRRYLEAVSDVWDLDPLATALHDQSTISVKTVDIDLVIQVDEVLHSVPVPHLIIRDRPLFEQVRSCRVSLSVLLDTLQEGVEVSAQRRQPNSRRMLAVSWFDPGDSTISVNSGDPAGVGGVLLHQLHSRTAKEFNLSYFAAAEKPTGSRDTLLRALDEEGYCLATILGHGSLIQSGIRFADDVWNGQGRALDGVEFLIIPSCSIGRVQQTGVRNVQGFCVTLALHKARAALACRWKVNALEAPYFADEVARQYLSLRKTASPEEPGARLRARAVNLARKELIARNHRSGHAHVGLNTAAAFELYGRG